MKVTVKPDPIETLIIYIEREYDDTTDEGEVRAAIEALEALGDLIRRDSPGHAHVAYIDGTVAVWKADAQEAWGEQPWAIRHQRAQEDKSDEMRDDR